jgi:hypothetical protein
MIENFLKGFLPLLPVLGLVVFMGVVAAGVSALFKKQRSSSEQDFSSYSLDPFLLSKAEYSFYQVLRQVLGDKYSVFPKVRLADIVKVLGGKHYYSAFNRIQIALPLRRGSPRRGRGF